MAKVKIQGHASGTGVLTVTAPNTSTDRTITLPDSTGTLATTADTFNPDAAVTINESGADVDFRVESDTDANSLFVQGSDGMVGIGTGTPTYTLDVYKSAVGNVARFNSSSGNRSLNITSADNGSYLGAVWKRDINSSGGTHIWSTNGTERLRLQQAGGISFNGDTATANALDDYEEGTWTPACSTATISVLNSAVYTKIGRVVNASCYINLANDGTSANAELTGLPFTIQTNTYPPAVFQFSANSGSGTVGRGQSNSTTVSVYREAGNQTGVPTNEIDNGHWMVNITYMV